MVALRLFLVLLPLVAAMPSSNALEHTGLVRRHCEVPNNCGAAIKGTTCQFCCGKAVTPSTKGCKAVKDKACEADGKKDGVTYNCDAD